MMKNVFKLLMMVAVFSAFSLSAMADGDQKDKQQMSREQLVEKQAQYIADNLALDDQKTKRFIDTYTQCQREVWALGPRKKARRDNLDEAATEKELKERFDHSQKLLDLRRKYYNIYSGFLTQKQIQRVYQLEKQMKERFAKHAKDGKRGGKGDKGGRGGKRPDRQRQ